MVSFETIAYPENRAAYPAFDKDQHLVGFILVRFLSELPPHRLSWSWAGVELLELPDDYRQELVSCLRHELTLQDGQVAELPLEKLPRLVDKFNGGGQVEGFLLKVLNDRDHDDDREDWGDIQGIEHEL